MWGSPRPRAGYVALAAAVAVLTACGSKSSSPHRCATSAECPADTRCVASACVANAAPIAEVVVPAAPLETNVLLSFDASSSHDPDTGDALASFAWTFRAGPEVSCAAPVVAGTQPVATVRFGCAGHYEGDLTVTDQLGATATKTFTLDVVDYTGSAMVTAGPDVSVEHACTSRPTRCQLASGAVVLSAATAGVAPDGVSFRWTVEPPSNRTLGANRRVAFLPNDAVASPSVSIETDGQGISGDWVFRVEARDAAGVIGAAATRVSVGNRPPVVTKTIPAVQHLFSNGSFIASGEVPFTISDPDGDPLVGPVVEWRHVGDGSGTFTGALLADGSGVAFSISVPYARPSDGQFLIGGAELERAIVFSVEDVNGASHGESWPIVVENHPPVLVSAPGPFTVNHSYDGAALEYVASPTLSSWSDPDGDPLFQVPSSPTGDPLCPTFSVVDGSGGRVATGRCALAFAGDPSALANLVGAHVVAQAVQDPWLAAAGTSTVGFTVANRPPVFTPATFVRKGSCSRNGWCGELPNYTSNDVIASVSPFTDPDGDPLYVTASSAPDMVPIQPTVDTPPYALAVQISSMELCVGDVATGTFSSAASDGIAGAAGSFTIQRICP